MKGHRRALSTSVPELLVGTSLAYLNETQSHKNSNDLRGLQYRNVPHPSGNDNSLNAHELRVEFRLPRLKQHLQNLSKI